VNNKALEVALSMGLSVAINIIADPDWDEVRFAYPRHGYLLPRQAKRRTATSPASTPTSAAEPGRC
jgi:hypothetical protein